MCDTCVCVCVHTHVCVRACMYVLGECARACVRAHVCVCVGRMRVLRECVCYRVVYIGESFLHRLIKVCVFRFQQRAVEIPTAHDNASEPGAALALHLLRPASEWPSLRLPRVLESAVSRRPRWCASSAGSGRRTTAASPSRPNSARSSRLSCAGSAAPSPTTAPRRLVPACR